MVNPAGQLGSSVSALVNEYHTISHNMANINTVGYKRNVNAFSRELMELTGNGGDDSLPVGELNAKGFLDFSQGSLLATGRTLDVAIKGKGFFVIETPDGPLYSRNGVLQVNTQGQLADIEGRLIAGEGGPIVLPPNTSSEQLAISEDGRVKAGEAVLGKLRVVEFGEDEGQLLSVGNNCYAAPEDLRPAASEATVQQGYRENSNVKLVEELINLMTVSRLYETNMNLLRKRQENSKVMIGVANG